LAKARSCHTTHSNQNLVPKRAQNQAAFVQASQNRDEKAVQRQRTAWGIRYPEHLHIGRVVAHAPANQPGCISQFIAPQFPYA
jgi:hypothetical protein